MDDEKIIIYAYDFWANDVQTKKSARKNQHEASVDALLIKFV